MQLTVIPAAARVGLAGLFALGLAACGEDPESSQTTTTTEQAADDAVSQVTDASADGLAVPIEYYTLDNGLKVVLSQDHSVPTATVAVYYNIGFRIEPKDRTGFAHLFEHMMFQGSENLGKNAFINLINSSGGVLNGSTRYDFTNYYQVVPAHKLETILWAEADRMKGLAITQENLTNQQGVVKNEVKVNVLNQPYGGFPWLDMPQYANENWFNAHNFYGELDDLDAATLEDVQAFFDTYYSPNNAVLVVAGDFDPAEVKPWIEQYYGGIESAELPELPDISEPRQEAEKRFEKTDALAPRPALAVSYKVPERGTPEHIAMGMLAMLLIEGEDSLLHQELVAEKGYAGSVFGGINMLGNMFNYNGPVLFTYALIHDPSVEPDTILADADAIIERLRTTPVSEEELERARVKVRSTLYDLVGSSTRFGLVDLLAVFALFDEDPGKINELEAMFAEVTPGLVQQVAQDYLRSTNRTILEVVPGSAS